MFRLRTIDKIPEAPSAAAARGTLVHSVLEHLFDLPRGSRTVEAAQEALPERWSALTDSDPMIAEAVDNLEEFFATARDLLATYFTLEDPNRYEPAAREKYVSHNLPNGPQLRGIIDRMDIAPNGAIRIVDYKTGRSPSVGYEADALFQMLFYAAVVRAQYGRLPAMAQLLYLGDGNILRHTPTDAEADQVIRDVLDVWASVRAAARIGRFEEKTSRLCPWCVFQQYCPAFGGTPPPLDPVACERVLGVGPTSKIPDGSTSESSEQE
jgi:putative RecB family exonuclease